MSATELKAGLHTLIENCEDEGLLEGPYKILNASQKQDEKDWWNELDEEDKLRLEESMVQYEEGKYTSNDTVMQKAKEWLKK